MFNSSMWKLFSDTVKHCARNSAILLVCPRCGAATKAATGKARKTKTIDTASPPVVKKTTEEKAKAAKEALRQAANELDVTYASLGYGSAGASSNKDGVPVVDNNLAKVFRAGRSFPGEMYIARDAIADRIACLMSISPKDDCIIVEGNPGMGLLTKSILDRGAKRIRVFENRAVFVYRLQALQQEYGPEKVEIICPYNIYDYRRKSVKKSDKDALAHLNTVTTPPDVLAPATPAVLLTSANPMEAPSLEARFEDLINQGRDPVDWSRETPGMKFVGVVPQLIGLPFLRRLISNVARRRGFCSHGRPEFFLLMTHKQMLNIQAGGTECSFTSMRWISIALQSFFDITVLQSVSRHDLLPPLPTSANKFDESWSLVRLTAKRDLPQQLDWSVLAEYVFFVNQAMSSRRKPIISWFERWIPGYGRHLLDLGKNLYLRAGDLTAQDYIDLFQLVSASPEYPTSNLKTAFLSSSYTDLPDVETEEDDAEDEQIVPHV